MGYNDIISRLNVQALQSDQLYDEVISGMGGSSVVMPLMTRLPNLTKKQGKIPVMSVLPHTYFVDGDTGYKQTTKAEWDNVYIVAEELAAVVPISEAVLEDSDYDIWGAIRGPLVEAFGRAFDRAVLHGENAPESWPKGIVQAAVDASHDVNLTTDLYQDICGVHGLLDKVESDGYAVNGAIAQHGFKARLRGVVDLNGQPIFRTAYSTGAAGSMVYELDGTPITFPENGAMNIDDPLVISGNFKKAVYALRKDITFKLFTEGVITDNRGNVIYNLMQQDMVALRAVMRIGWALPNPVNAVNPNAASRYPFSVLTAENVTEIQTLAYSVTAPAKGATPQATITAGTGYTGAIEWSPADAAFAAETEYTAVVTYTATSGYVFDLQLEDAGVTGLPKTTPTGKAQSVEIDRVSPTELVITVVYKATAA
ncbi:MAG: phage major capsid protein [Actinomycetaceae bacterium]|nr:phage major capsid protein [Actinomycetaceae bacterium]